LETTTILVVVAVLAVAGLLTLAWALPAIRRTRRALAEYKMVTDIGQAVSSRLDEGEILRTVHRELGSVCETRSFYIAFRENGSVSFEYEVVNGEPMPSRQRAVSRGVVEHILEKREPLLLRSGIAERLKQLGIDEAPPGAKSFCGVPLFMGGEAVGVMAAMCDRENAYDQRDVELLRTVGTQLAISLQNARRFRREQHRAEYLSFLNNIAKAAISSKKPEELLTRVAEEVQHSFGFDHLSIGVVDYSRKQVEVRAEGGREDLRIGVGTRVPLEAAAAGLNTARNPLRPSDIVVAQSAHAVLAHPITYGETLLGILVIESLSRKNFSEEETLTMATLADVLATSLHNVMTFEEMEYQSITDCLTGIKTRRYFLEAIQSEWSRAARAGRPFSLLLIDLDKFKQVNDGQGHLEGDLVLARVGRILEQKCRQSNVVARYGGDEFVVLLPETSLEQAQTLGERLRKWLATDPVLSERGVTGSFGVSSFPLHGATIEEIIRQADEAMYVSKSLGGDRVSTPPDEGDAAAPQSERVAAR
jgi:diguanylate cyclase (GGDEF)-like protein